ncbi:biotin--[acetyl-CoA-carboxylase] ligase [Propylenella binzhouense]|uniref:biotin--[biotin carboxyl-carrier protein] ligase n=1 Tax=Propylenella binzhouense TaxID=2555902 RepID=A0A964T3J1_9HYPH|nr:biotin--[acetyl-CoA-carboxylase] ligase [Propylenella binzhouense]MYZ47821.1 biotin--[acetyl-CoA-carboxylase] ligase [Propylenella binzhouense]
MKPTEGVRRIILERIGSTNDEAMRRLLAGEPHPFWVTAARQESGRGRLGSTWVSEPGNLYASLGLVRQIPLPILVQLPTVAALAAYGAVLRVLPDTLAAGLAIKWPNDLLLGGRKVAGILAESRSLGERGTAIVVGIGVNCRHAPTETRYPATSLAASGVTVDPDLLFDALAGEMARELAAWDEGRGFQDQRRRWNAAAASFGETITVRLPRETLVGRFMGLDEAGYLRLVTEGGERRISAGDVFFGSDQQEFAPHG